MESILLLVSLILFIVYVGLIVYYRQGWLSLPLFEKTVVFLKPTTRITIIIPARNEAANIGNCLQSICNQTYPADLFEVIVVDDHSTDETVSIIHSFSQNNIRCILLKDYVTDPINSYKKKAIEIAISKSTGDLIVTTDADCYMGKDWLTNIAGFYETYSPDFIAAPVAIQCSLSFIEIFQALDFMTLQGITGAAVHKKLHSMCNGANLAYSKKVFEEVGGFKGIDNIASGDDMLLMHKIYDVNPTKVMFLKSADAIVYTEPAKTLKDFINQRIRWASKADKYDDKTILPVLIAVYFFNVCMLLIPIVAIFNNINCSFLTFNFSLLTFWLYLLLLKTLVELFFLYPVAQFFNKQSLLWLFPVMQPFHIVYTIIAGWLGKFGTYKWKERKVK
ncbi:MAG: glycosyltransferase [Ferruginibacter sp.]